MSKRYILIGASAASMGALHKLRQCDPDAQITLFSAEKELPYNKCLLADLLAGIITQEKVHLYPTGNKVTLELDTTIVAIDPVAKTITSHRGISYSYDALFLGMGSGPWVPPIPGIHSKGVFTFHTLADTRAIQEYIKNYGATKVVICGAGLSGLEVADALKAQGLQITIIEKNSHVLPHLLTSTAAHFLHEHMRSIDIQIMLDKHMQEIAHQADKVTGIYLANGEYIEADLVIITTGLRANIALCHQADINNGPNGVLINEYMRTNQPDIYAGGDLIEVTDILSGNRLRSCMWPDAMQQGMFAALAMTGQPKIYPGPSIIISSAFFGLKFAKAGLLELESKRASGQQFYHEISQKEGILTGLQVLGTRHNLGLLRRFLLTKQPILDSLDQLF